MKKIRSGITPIDQLKEDLNKTTMPLCVFFKDADIKNQEIRFFNQYEVIGDSSTWWFITLSEICVMIKENSTSFKKREVVGIDSIFGNHVSFYSGIPSKVASKIRKYLNKRKPDTDSDRNNIEKIINCLDEKADGILISSILIS